jgi:hypothetical protein
MSIRVYVYSGYTTIGRLSSRLFFIKKKITMKKHQAEMLEPERL